MTSIRAVQERLSDLGFEPGPIDGVWGQSTGRALMRALDRLNPAWPGQKTSIADAQTRLRLMGFSPGPSDNLWGGRTGTAAMDALARLQPPARAATRIVPGDWLSRVPMQRVVLHWTAGQHTPSGLDRAHYHILIAGDGTLVRGVPSIAANQAPVRPGYAAHTLNCNGGAIGVALCCMAGAVESPFYAGQAPMTRAQWDAAALVIADLCETYSIPVGPKTVLTHAEVQGTLGIRQRGKIDFIWEPSMSAPGPAREVGDRLRKAAQAALAK